MYAWSKCLTKILKEKRLLSDYLNQIYGSLPTLSHIQCFASPSTPAAKAACLQELAGYFRPKLSPDQHPK